MAKIDNEEQARPIGIGVVFKSSKTYTHSQGLSCCFRQWKADSSHCKYLHGYALQVHVEFEAERLDERNWVQDFGGLKWLKLYLEETFDHKTLVAEDDPHLAVFNLLDQAGLIQLKVVEAVGCEKFAEMIYWKIDQTLHSGSDFRVRVTKVTVSEHDGNSASVVRKQ